MAAQIRDQVQGLRHRAAFYLWIYTPRAHEDGTVAKIIEEVLAFTHQPSTEAIQRSIDAFIAHDTASRLSHVAVPTLVLAGGLDMITPPRFGRAVADAIPGARFEVLAEEAHQPFQTTRCNPMRLAGTQTVEGDIAFLTYERVRMPVASLH